MKEKDEEEGMRRLENQTRATLGSHAALVLAPRSSSAARLLIPGACAKSFLADYNRG